MQRKRNLSTENEPPTKKVKTASKGHWSLGLKDTLGDKDNILKKTEHVSIIKDKFPKSKHHYLVVHPTITSIYALSKQHIDLVQHMVKVGEDFISEVNKDSTHVFKMGFHAVPSMQLLHLHVMSNDHDSVCLKHRKHWNSFTTEFFMPPKDILKQLEEEGNVKIDKQYYEELLKKGLACHLCKEKPKNMPTLKKHILLHFKK